MSPVKLTQALGPAERRLVIAMCVAGACVATMSVSFNFLLVPIEDTFEPTEAQMSVLRQAPSIAALLVVFPAGALGARLGEKRFTVASGLLFSLGCLLVAVAPVIEVATLGFLVANVGRTGMFIVGLAYMSAAVRNEDGRAAAFSLFYMVLPVVSIVMPVVTGVLSDGSGWRWVGLICAGLGLVGTAVIVKYVPPTPRHGDVGEMWTLALAGVILALVVFALDSARPYGVTSPEVLVPAGLACLAAVVLAILMRRLPAPTLDLSPLRQGGFTLLLVVLMLFGFANLWFYTTMALQYVYGLDIVEAAIAMIPAQVTAVAGAAGAGRLVQKLGIPRAGFVLIVAVAVLLWSSMVVTSGSPLWVPIAIVSLYAAAAVGAGVPLTNAIMNTAPSGTEGTASAFRGAATNLGNALSVALMTTVVAFAISGALRQGYQQEGFTESPSESSQILEAVNQGASSQDVASQYSVPVADVEELTALEKDAFMTGYRAQGLVGGTVTLALGFVFLAVTRRQERSSPSRMPR